MLLGNPIFSTIYQMWFSVMTKKVLTIKKNLFKKVKAQRKSDSIIVTIQQVISELINLCRFKSQFGCAATVQTCAKPLTLSVPRVKYKDPQIPKKLGYVNNIVTVLYIYIVNDHQCHNSVITTLQVRLQLQ